MEPEFHPPVDQARLRQLLTVGIVVSLCIASLAALVIYARNHNLLPFPKPSFVASDVKLSTFKTATEFSNYIQKGREAATGYFGGIGRAADLNFPEQKAIGSAPAAQPVADRVSQTNVQVKGIDEPDVVKTDGKNIYFSPQMFYLYGKFETPPSLPTREVPTDAKLIAPFPAPNNPVGQTHIINALPATAISKVGKIDQQGELLLENNKLLVLSGNFVTAFDVSDPKAPKELWKKELDNNFIVTARLMQGKLVLITQNYISEGTPCPLPLFRGGITIPCDRIYYPNISIAVDSTYTVTTLDPQSGNVSGSVSFVGAAGSTVVYVSQNAIYTTYSYPGDFLSFYHNFLAQRANDLIPASVTKRLSDIKAYDISNQSKLTELQLTLDRYKASLSRDEALKLENELQNRMTKYAKEHARELETTGIVKVNAQNLSVVANGAIPGHPLNQFSIDENQGVLRIATTSQGSYMAAAESVNDIYTLDENLRPLGSLTDLGVGEQIYSARFLGDQAYLVTYKQIDPFFVIDLSNPRAPRKAGELKIPGYSSYLHPLENNTILGVGQEDGRVKLSLFDVSNANNPNEIAKYSLNEYWTEASNNHHAFLQDEKHKIFFLPGGNGGYIFSYQNKALTLTKALADMVAKRAVYINDYLYIIGENKIVVVNEANWETVSTLPL